MPIKPVIIPSAESLLGWRVHEGKSPQKILRLTVKPEPACPKTTWTKLFGKVGLQLEEKVQREQLWCGRHVKVFDGSSVSMPDTPENQKAYPQPSSQKAGCGFPLAKIGVLFSLTTGAAIALVIDVFKTHDVKEREKIV